MRKSISHTFLVRLALTSIICTVLVAVTTFLCFERELEFRQAQFLSQYVQERTDNVGRRFSDLITLQHSAIDAFETSVQGIDAASARALLERYTEAKPDGTRRSRPQEFDGYYDAQGGRNYGVGAFLPRASELDDLQARILAAAFPIVARFGQAAHGSYDNFYFFTPENRVVLFGPDRPDRLIYYRQNAPADLDFTREEMSRLIQPQVDPGRETRCTSLQRLLQDKSSAPRVATACLTPVYVRGRYVGAFGSSLDLKPFFARAVLQGFPGAESLIIRKDGQLLAAPGAAVADPLSVKRYQSQLDLTALAKDLVASKRAFGVMSSPNKKDIIAYGRLAAPGWYMLLRYPAAKIMGSAAVWASWILLLGLACAALQTMILLHLAASSVIRPLAALAQSCEAENHAVPDELLRRPDEIGVLAQSLKAERARSEELLASLEDRVQQRTAELEKANAEKSRFLANMSHELRTPLNGVIALSETLAQAQTSPRNIEVAELIVSSGRLLEQVLTDILDFSKIEAGEMRLEAHPFDLGVTVSGVAELHRAAAQAKGLELRWQMAQEAAGTYLGDPVRLTQVLSNLLSNAVKFTASGGVVLSVAAQDGGLAFSVADTGIGFPPSVRETLFQRFEQADLSIRRRFGGTGLGLAICRSLVGLMGGSIDAQSTPGQGSVFFFTIPLERAQPANAQPSDRQEGSSPSLDGVSVLLAEDHPTNQKIVQLILEASGVDLVTVENGRQALTAVELRPFDLILMDMQMPELDGLTATVLLRQREAAEGLRRTPVIMLTANALDEHRQASLEAGADQHLSKPIRANELLRAMNAVIAARDDRGRQSASA